MTPQKKSVQVALVGSFLLCGSVHLHAADATRLYRYTDKYGHIVFTDQKHNGAATMALTWKGWVGQDLNVGSTTGKYSFNWKLNQQKYDPYIRQLARQYGISHILLHAVIATESSYNPKAVSHAGAVGLMQLMPGTAARYGVNDREHPEENMRGGVHYLSDLLARFNSVKLALAAYNAGENAVARYGNKVPPFKETRHYIKKVMKYYREYNKSMANSTPGP